VGRVQGPCDHVSIRSLGFRPAWSGMAASNTSPGGNTGPPPIRTTSEIVWYSPRKGRIAAKTVRPSVRPATLWTHVVYLASARVIAGRILVSRRAGMDVPAPGANAWNIVAGCDNGGHATVNGVPPVGLGGSAHRGCRSGGRAFRPVPAARRGCAPSTRRGTALLQ
jgi:hypothetical protein